MDDHLSNPETESSLRPEVADAPQIYDVIIAGGGISGALTCSKLRRSEPTAQMLLLEKEPNIGGRLQRYSKDVPWSYGLGVITSELFDFWDQELKTDPEADDLSAYEVSSQTSAGFLVGNKVNEVAVSELCSQKGARVLGGLAASKQWPDVEKALSPEDGEASSKGFGDLVNFPRKGPAAIVLETLSGAVGVPDIWSANVNAIRSRMNICQSGLRKGAWSKPLSALTMSQNVDLKTGCLIVHADFDEAEKIWTVKTEKGTFQTRRLVIAQSPWQASLWLPKKYWPVTLLNLVNKTKPVSVVTLSYRIVNPDKVSTPDLLIVPSEGVQIVREFKDRIVFQATIDFELSLQAPDVLKAVKALKRAARKLQATFPDLKIENEHIALLPVGWSHSPAASERKYFEKLDIEDIQKPHLVFVGDAYGNSYDGDHNIVESVRVGVEVLSECQRS